MDQEIMDETVMDQDIMDETLMDQEIMDETVMDQEIMDETEQRKTDCRPTLHSSADRLKTDTDWLIDNLNNECRLEELKEYMDEYRGKIERLKQISSYEDAVLTYLKDVESRLSDLLKKLSEGSNIQQHVIEFVQWQKGKIEELKKIFLCQQDNSLLRYSLAFDDINNSLLRNTQEEYANAREINPTELEAKLSEKKEFITKLILSKGDLNELHWRKCVELWYPERHSKAYFLPPQHFHREQVEEVYVGNALVTKKEALSNAIKDPSVHAKAKDDQAQEDILIQLNELSKETKDAMMVISQLEYENYLHKACYSEAAAHYPNLKDLPNPEYRRGDFDLLIIHRKFGIIVGEIKSVNYVKALRERITTARLQLTKAENVLQHLLKDLPYIKKISKAIFLPNIDVAQFKTAISKDTDLMEDLQKQLETEELTDVIFLKDTHVSGWWHRLTRGIVEMEMTDEQYDNILVRFCGPATTVGIFCLTPPRLEVRTVGQAVAETGRRMARLTLLPQQVELIHSNKYPHTFLCGPPGTGKTIVLLLKGIKWMEEGYNVHLISSWYKSRPSIFLIENQLRRNSDKGGVYTHFYQFEENNNDIERAVNDLSSAAKKEREKGKDIFCVIVDEPGPDLDEDALRMFQRSMETKRYTYHTPMPHKEGVKTLEDKFEMSEDEIKEVFPESVTNTEWTLSLQMLQEFNTNYNIANRCRRVQARKIFVDFAKDKDLGLSKNEAMIMLRETQMLQDDDKKVEELFQTITNNSKRLTLEHFQRYYATHEQLIECRKEQACQRFREYRKQYKKSLTKSESIKMLQGELRLTEDQALVTFQKTNKQNVISKPEYDSVTKDTELGEKCKPLQFRDCLRYYGRTLCKSEAFAMLIGEYSVPEADLETTFTQLCQDESEEEVSEDTFLRFYTSNEQADCVRKKDAQDIFYRYLNKYTQSIDIKDALDLLKEKCQMSEQTAKDKLKEKENGGELTFAEFQEIFIKHKFPLEYRKQCAEELFKLHSEISEAKNSLKRNLSKLRKNQFIINSVEAKYIFTKIVDNNEQNNEVLRDSFRDFYSKYTNAHRSEENHFSVFCEKFLKSVRHARMWVGAIERFVKPLCLVEERMTVPLRNPLLIVDKVKQASQIANGCVHQYTDEKLPSPIRGYEFLEIHHTQHTSHEQKQPKECEECGIEIYKHLEMLGVTKNATGIQLQGTLEQRDVIILCEDPRDKETDANGKQIDASGLVRGLRSYDISVRVVKRDAEDKDIKDTALAKHNMVTVSHYRHAHGLERKVVVLAGNMTWQNDYNTLYDMSRCTAQIIEIITQPRSSQNEKQVKVI